MQSERASLGARLEEARHSAGMNKNQLARAIGTSWQHIDGWERDRVVPSMASLQRLASVLGVSVSHLLGEEVPLPRAVTEALSTFLLRYAPPDLSEAETEWLRAAPVDPSLASPGLYLDLLHRLRSAPAAPKPSTGRRLKVEISDLPPEARAIALAQQKKS